MRLTTIKLAGFKSFVDPISINLPSNLIGVVGPNGCGKSNIIDAIRWVMGESSAKHLRGESMADVIFNGSNTRKPIGQASIELVFDNADGQAGGQYASYSEISIKRQVSRDGISNYYLNNTRCRRRDIADVFMGTGLGPNSYSIIEQGMISRVIDAKPEELRKHLEEAAGISKYKERRKETETRIRHTRENLDRLNDLREEVEKQLERLQRQAKTAEKYKVLKEEERIAKAQLLALRWAGINERASKEEQLISEQETALEAQIAGQRRIEADIENQHQGLTVATDEMNKVQASYYSIGSEIARIEQEIKHANERRQQQQEDLGQVEHDLADVQMHMDTDRTRIEELKVSLAEIEPERAEAIARQKQSGEVLDGVEGDMQSWMEEWEEFNRNHANATQTSQVQRTRIEHLEQQLQELQGRIARCEMEAETLETGSAEEAMASVAKRIEEREDELKQLQDQIQACHDEINAQRSSNKEMASKLDEARSELQTILGRHSSVEALQQAALGKGESGIISWLEKQGLKDSPRLAEQLEVDKGWEKAVETVLGQHLEAICVDGIDPVASVLNTLEKGVLGVVNISANAHSADSAQQDTLLSKVSSRWDVVPLLSGIYVAGSLQEALAMRSNLGAHESVVTADGIWLGNGWLRVARDPDEKAGILQREQQLKSLETEIRTRKAAVTELEQRMDEGNGLLQSSEDKREQIQRTLSDTTRHHAELKSQLGSYQAQVEHAVSRSTDIHKDMEALHQQISAAQQELKTARDSYDEAIAVIRVLDTQKAELEQQRDEVKAALEKAREQAHTDKELAHEVELKSGSMQTALKSTQENIERMEGRLSNLTTRREELQSALAKGEQPVEILKQELEVSLEKRVTVEAELSRARDAVQAIDLAMKQLNEDRHTAEEKVLAVRELLEKMRLGWQEMNVRRQTCKEQIDESGFELEKLQEDMPAEANEHDWAELTEKLEGRISRLGPINLAAIDEYGEQSKRKEYLDSQHADVSEALNTLEAAIQKIDRETRTKFKETFDKVNSGVQKIFPRLFGGGQAHLELVGDDLLDTGVTIMARPPGKRISSIQLLSGGEKALTAVSLVFAIFELNPAPFCLLDEVDAPLDDANVGRFCEMVKERSSDTQFIFITHNKITMEIANQLVGVTMQEAGVSRLVAVDVEEAVQLVAV